MAWRKVWKQKRSGSRRNVWLLRWYDNLGNMKGNTFHGDAKAADEECRRREHELNDGTLGQRRDVDWLTFCEEYLLDLASRNRSRTVEDYRKVLGTLTQYCRPKRVSDVTASLLREFVRVQTDGRAPATRNKLVRTLRAIFSWAVPEYLKENPAKRVGFVTEPETDKRTLSPEEFFKTLAVIDDREQAVLIFGTCCGLRREEIAYLRWEDVDLEAATARVCNTAWHISKSGKQRTVLMPPALMQVLRRMKALEMRPFVFPEVYRTFKELPNAAKREWSQHYREAIKRKQNREGARKLAWAAVQHHQKPDRPINPNRLTDLVPRLVRKAGLPHCTLHDLRRTFCSYLAERGVDTLVTQKLAGHSSPAVTARYYIGTVPEMLRSQERLPFWHAANS